jgi:hypothetical protein
LRRLFRACRKPAITSVRAADRGPAQLLHQLGLHIVDGLIIGEYRMKIFTIRLQQ